MGRVAPGDRSASGGIVDCTRLRVRRRASTTTDGRWHAAAGLVARDSGELAEHTEMDKAAALTDYPSGLLEQIKVCNSVYAFQFPVSTIPRNVSAQILGPGSFMMARTSVWPPAVNS